MKQKNKKVIRGTLRASWLGNVLTGKGEIVTIQAQNYPGCEPEISNLGC